MIEVNYGVLPKDSFCRYFEFLIDRTYKILGLKEEECSTLIRYLQNLQIELVGQKDLVYELVDEPKFISVLGIIQYLISEECDTREVRRQVFKCTHLLEDINVDHFGGVRKRG